MRGPAPICLDCTRFHADDRDALTCDAFTKAIPEAIIFSEHDHREPFPGDHGIQFEPQDAASAKRAESRFP